MSGLRVSRWLAPALALTLFSFAPAARAEDEALVRFERGVQLYEAENYDAALVEFSSAYRLSKNYKLLYNIGICQMATREYAAAADSFRQYIAEGDNELTDARRKDVQDRLSKLALMVARVRITSNAPAGTVLLVDDRPAGKLPLSEPLTVKTGRRQFSVLVAGRSVVKAVDVASGEVSTVELVVEAPAAAPASSAPAAATTPPPASGPSFPWPLWVVTGALAGGAAVTGLVAVGARNDLGRDRATYGVSPSTLEAEQSRARTFGLVSDGLLVGALVGAGLSTYFTIRFFRAAPAASGKGVPGPATSGRQASADGLVVTPASVQFTRSF